MIAGQPPPAGTSPPHSTPRQSMKPVLIAIHDHAGYLASIRRELLKRYADDYEVVCEASAEAGLARLGALRDAGAEVLVMMAAEHLQAMTGTELLERAHELHA